MKGCLVNELLDLRSLNLQNIVLPQYLWLERHLIKIRYVMTVTDSTLFMTVTNWRHISTRAIYYKDVPHCPPSMLKSTSKSMSPSVELFDHSVSRTPPPEDLVPWTRTTTATVNVYFSNLRSPPTFWRIFTVPFPLRRTFGIGRTLVPRCNASRD